MLHKILPACLASIVLLVPAAPALAGLLTPGSLPDVAATARGGFEWRLPTGR